MFKQFSPTLLVCVFLTIACVNQSDVKQTKVVAQPAIEKTQDFYLNLKLFDVTADSLRDGDCYNLLEKAKMFQPVTVLEDSLAANQWMLLRNLSPDEYTLPNAISGRLLVRGVGGCSLMEKYQLKCGREIFMLYINTGEYSSNYYLQIKQDSALLLLQYQNRSEVNASTEVEQIYVSSCFESY